MAQSAVTVRIDSEMKAQFDELCNQFGMSSSQEPEMTLEEINAEIRAAREERRKKQPV